MAEGSVWGAYRAVLGSRLRSQTGYRTSFALELLGSLATGLMELAEVYVILHNVHVLGGLGLTAALMVFALAHVAFSLSDLFTGQLDTVMVLIRAGTLDVLLVRPLPLIGQLVTGEVALRRLARTALSLVVLGWAVTVADISWTASKVALLVVTPIAGTALFGAVWVVAGALQFWLVDGGEFTNAFTYGGGYAASFSAAVLPMPLRLFFTFVVPATFTGYLPTLALLDLPAPAGLAPWLGWSAPLAAVAAWAAALALWRAGVRHYTGGGG